nr:MAG TPA: hypothetical protein [Caudoviricetes sp.]DAZ58787.1 MAG TPA: hypothetical protein [Caudoviricetes sp.]
MLNPDQNILVTRLISHILSIYILCNPFTPNFQMP